MDDLQGFDVVPKALTPQDKGQKPSNARALAQIARRLDRVNVLTYLDRDTQGHLLSPFVKHYTSIGVASRRISTAIGVQAVTPELKQMVIDLKASGIRAPKLVPNTLDAASWRMSFYRSRKKQSRRTNGSYGPRLMNCWSCPSPLLPFFRRLKKAASTGCPTTRLAE